MILIHKATIINEGEQFIGSLLIEGERIGKIFKKNVPERLISSCDRVIEANGLYLLPGVIDDHVHFRDPGLTYEGDIASESRAGVAGGVTSYMDMPNTKPQTITIDAWRSKMASARGRSFANYAFYLGATNDNLQELKKADPKQICGIKVFMGSSTGNMLVDDPLVLQQIFAEVDMLIATHCEKEEIIRANREHYLCSWLREHQGDDSDDLPIEYHRLIRSEEACYRSLEQAVELADRYKARLHVLHMSTAREMSLLDNSPLPEKRITGEVCVHHLWFCDEDYSRLGTRIKWNPSIKTAKDREALRRALLAGRLDVVATDHSPHLLIEKRGGALRAASGGPLVQHSLQVMLELARRGIFTKELVVEKMCHAPACLFKVKNRGFIREGYYADLVLVDLAAQQRVSTSNILYKCGWSPFEGVTFHSVVRTTFVNGQPVYDNGVVDDKPYGMALEFDN